MLRVAEQLLRAAVEGFDRAPRVDDDDAVDRGVEDGVEPLGPGDGRCRGRALSFFRAPEAMIQPGDHQACGREHYERRQGTLRHGLD